MFESVLRLKVFNIINLTDFVDFIFNLNPSPNFSTLYRDHYVRHHQFVSELRGRNGSCTYFTSSITRLNTATFFESVIRDWQVVIIAVKFVITITLNCAL